jgi:hypothetical protein
MLRFSVLTWIRDDIAEMEPLAVAGWGYLLLGFFSGLGLLLTSGLRLTTGGVHYDPGTIAWAAAIFVLSLSGWVLLRSLRPLGERSV